MTARSRSILPLLPPEPTELPAQPVASRSTPAPLPPPPPPPPPAPPAPAAAAAPPVAAALAQGRRRRGGRSSFRRIDCCEGRAGAGAGAGGAANLMGIYSTHLI